MKFLTVLILSCVSCLCFSQTFQVSTNEPVDISAGKMTYKWDIEKVILENSNNITPLITQGKSSLKADMMIYDNKTEIGYAFGNLYYRNSAEQIILTSGEGTYNTKLKEIIVRQNPKILSLKDNTLAKSDMMKIYPDSDIIIMIGDVHITNTNFIIEGDHATMYKKTGLIVVIGHARATQEKTVMKADKISMQTSKGSLESYTAIDHVNVEDKKEGYTINSGRLDYYKDIGYSRITKNPVITFKDKNVQAYSIVMEKFDKEEKANLLGNVVIVQENKKAYGKWGEYYTKEKKMYLTGNPYLVEKKSRFLSDKIIFDVDTETMSMIGKGAGFYKYESN